VVTLSAMADHKAGLTRLGPLVEALPGGPELKASNRLAKGTPTAQRPRLGSPCALTLAGRVGSA
jgi:hypothetical protein